MNTDIDKMNATELKDYLHKFADAVYEYDGLRDDELNFLDEHPNREMWDSEQEQYYDGLLDDISNKWDYVREFLKTIDAEKYFVF